MRGSRVSTRSIPIWPCRCLLKKPCPYRQGEVCQEPRINKGNSDSACHNVLNKDLVSLLEAV